MPCPRFPAAHPGTLRPSTPTFAATRLRQAAPAHRAPRTFLVDSIALPAASDQPRSATAPAVAAGIYAALVALSVAFFIYQIPIQLHDSLNHLLNVQQLSLSEIMRSYFFQDVYVRPFWWAEAKIVFELSRGHYYEWFRGLHAVQACVLVALFVSLLRPRTWLDAALVTLALSVLIGMHTLNGTIREAFPVNHYLFAVLGCVTAAHLAAAAHHRWSDAAAVVVFIFSALTVESGLLVCVVTVGAYFAGQRGVSGRGVLVVAACFVLYFVLRLTYFGSYPPNLLERSSGFGFGVQSPDELLTRFGGNALPFYVYNVVCAALTVLFTEPRAGVFRYTAALLNGRINLPIASNVISSAVGTALIARYVWRRRAEWRLRRFNRDDQMIVIFAAVLIGNAGVSYAYTKDVIVAPAGVFYAGALFVAARHFATSSMAGRGVGRWGAMALLTVLAVTWAHRAAGSYAGLRAMAFQDRTEWVSAEEWVAREEIDVTTNRDRTLMLHVQGDALYRHPAPPPPADAVTRLLNFD